jgi:cytoskeleton protein RodZ
MPSIGETLRDARIRARFDMAEVESETKIRARYLRAMENEEWDVLPGAVYTKSFLRTYGDYLGLDSRMLVEEFKRRYERPAEHELRPVASARRGGGGGHRPRRGLRVPPWLAILVVLVGVGVALDEIGQNTPNSKTTNNVTNLHPGAHKRRHPRRRHRTPPSKPAKPKTVTLQLTPTAAVYVCLINGAGKHLIPGITYNVGQTIPTETARELYLTLGNANVQMKVDGKPVAVAPSSAPIAYRIRPRGTSTMTNGRQPSCP